jgi:hypothetical protein
MQLLAIFIAYPWAALLVGAVFLIACAQRKRVSAFLAGLLWSGYSGYEYLMLTRVLCSGDCNIRIDLLLIYPLLVIISVVAIVQMLRKSHQ